MRIVQNVVYDNSDPKKVCDIYCEENDETQKKPVVIVVHGGFWSLGCKEEMQEICEYLTLEKGYACVAIEYTLSNMDHDLFQKMVLLELIGLLAFALVASARIIKGTLLFAAFFCAVYGILKMTCSAASTTATTTHPIHVEDVAKSVAFIHKNISTYGNYDGNQIFLLGHSSGAHLVSLLTLNRRFLNNLNVPISIIKGVISISGPYSYWRIQDSTVKHLIGKSVFGGNITDDVSNEQLQNLDYDTASASVKDKWAKIVDAWPMFHEYAMDENTPPFLLLTAGIDLSLLYHARDFANVLQKNGAHAQIVHFDATNHFSIRTKWNSKNKQVGDIVQTFISTINEF